LIFLAESHAWPTRPITFFFISRDTHEIAIFIHDAITVIVDAIPTDLFQVFSPGFTWITSIINSLETVVVDAIPTNLFFQQFRRITAAPKAIHTDLTSFVAALVTLFGGRPLTGAAHAAVVHTGGRTLSQRLTHTTVRIIDAGVFRLAQPIAQANQPHRTIALSLASGLTFSEITDFTHITLDVFKTGFDRRRVVLASSQHDGKRQ